MVAETFNNIDPEVIAQLAPKDAAAYPVLATDNTKKPISKRVWTTLSNLFALRVPIAVVISLINKAAYTEYLTRQQQYAFWVRKQKAHPPGSQSTLERPHPGDFPEFGKFDDKHGWGGEFASGTDWTRPLHLDVHAKCHGAHALQYLHDAHTQSAL